MTSFRKDHENLELNILEFLRPRCQSLPHEHTSADYWKRSFIWKMYRKWISEKLHTNSPLICLMLINIAWNKNLFKHPGLGWKFASLRSSRKYLIWPGKRQHYWEQINTPYYGTLIIINKVHPVCIDVFLKWSRISMKF